MKNKFTYAALLLIAAALTNCKKSDKIDQELAGSENKLTAAVAPNTVETIAGTNYQSGPKLVDGPAATARFYYPFGLAMKDDGSFFIADIYNQAIRKVSPQGIVSTVQLQANSNGERIAQPTWLGFDDDNNLHVICRNVDSANGYSQSWIFAPGGKVVASWWYWYGEFSCLAKDPYENALWFSDGIDIGKHKLGEGGRIGTDYLEYDTDKLPETNDRGRTFSAIFVGYNKVKYIALDNLIYKLTPSGVFERIFTNLTFNSITSIVANKDSRTIYIADSGAIRKIENNKVTTLVGPNKTNPHGQDGVGANADVWAGELVLGKGENVIYFTDIITKTLRKLTLK
ncbi:hypothetical protein EOD41_04450 [Mucilaginibacter limnophilus]|uniref:SMP-30/Gluconolactonase/LRE-like region domain-containing protein n=1 Tax=Mucilaginibacter limnophilus TaxID=1932778 RepID=A0A437MU84_9SPHI|nr:hypothetical protein [Mucilaginibacter limnophilus]RVU01222.1 hypothetical protein EOD41_04450 [Mucilaginibacter limnophilus]